MKMKSRDYLIDLLFPRRCPVCDDAVPFGRLICPGCESKPEKVNSCICMRCGRQFFEEGDWEYCASCLKKEHYFIRGRSLYLYRSISESLLRLKDEGRQEYVDYFGRKMAEGLGSWILSLKPGVLVPVPMHRKKQRKRGFNQAELLADALGSKLGIPVDPELVVRPHATRAARQLNTRERAILLKNAFKINKDSVKWDTAVIIDDIFTSGATVDGVAKELLKAGVNRIFFACLATGETSPPEEEGIL